jgi:hypothetical protein
MRVAVRFFCEGDFVLVRSVPGAKRKNESEFMGLRYIAGRFEKTVFESKGEGLSFAAWSRRLDMHVAAWRGRQGLVGSVQVVEAKSGRNPRLEDANFDRARFYGDQWSAVGPILLGTAMLALFAAAHRLLT